MITTKFRQLPVKICCCTCCTFHSYHLHWTRLLPTDWNLTSDGKEQLGDLNAAYQLYEPPRNDCTHKHKRRFSLFINIKYIHTSDKSLRDNRCASTRSVKAFGLKVFVRLNKLLVGSHVEDRTQTHRKINRSPPRPPLLTTLCRQALHVWVFVLVRLFVTACCASCCCWAIPAENCTVGSEGESPRMSSRDVALPCRRGSHLNPPSVSISAENRLVRMLKITRKRKKKSCKRKTGAA